MSYLIPVDVCVARVVGFGSLLGNRCRISAPVDLIGRTQAWDKQKLTDLQRQRLLPRRHEGTRSFYNILFLFFPSWFFVSSWWARIERFSFKSAGDVIDYPFDLAQDKLSIDYWLLTFCVPNPNSCQSVKFFDFAQSLPWACRTGRRLWPLFEQDVQGGKSRNKKVWRFFYWFGHKDLRLKHGLQCRKLSFKSCMLV